MRQDQPWAPVQDLRVKVHPAPKPWSSLRGLHAGSPPATGSPRHRQPLLCCCKIQAATFHLVVRAWSFRCTGWDSCATAALQRPRSCSSLGRGCEDELLLKQTGDQSPPHGSWGTERCVPQR